MAPYFKNGNRYDEQVDGSKQPIEQQAKVKRTLFPENQAKIAKQIELDVLRLYDSGTTAEEIDSTIFSVYSEQSKFEDPLLRCHGLIEIRAIFQLLKKTFYAYQVVRPVKVGLWLGGKEGEGAKLLLDFRVQYQLLPLVPKIMIHQFTQLTINLEGRVSEHTDNWSISSVVSNIPIVGTILYPMKQRIVGYLASSVGGLIQPRVSLIYKMLLQS